MDPMDIPKPIFNAAIAGDQAALAEVFEAYRGRLNRMVSLRMDPRVQGRLDVSDVLQETFIEASRALPAYAADPKIPFYLWLRLLTGQRLAKTHRAHLGTAARQAQREVSIAAPTMPDLSTFHLASQLVANVTSASGQVVRGELRAKVQQVLDGMEAHDREVIALRHFEEMTSREVAAALGITESAAKSRYRRALIRVTEAFEVVPGVLEHFSNSSDEAQAGD